MSDTLKPCRSNVEPDNISSVIGLIKNGSQVTLCTSVIRQGYKMNDLWAIE